MRRLTVTVVSDIQVRNDGGTEGLNGGKQILIRPETYKRLRAFSQVVEAVTEENLNLESLATMVVDRGLEALLRDILEKTAGTSSSEELQGVEVLLCVLREVEPRGARCHLRVHRQDDPAWFWLGRVVAASHGRAVRSRGQ